MERGDRTEAVGRLREAGCVYAEEEADLLLAELADSSLFGDAVRQRTEGRPLEHVLGYATFCGLRIAVRAPVFVPRRRAEPLARAAVDEVRARPPGMTVLDLGCGSGAIAATVAAGTVAAGTVAAGAAGSAPAARVWASDVSEPALACARDNAARYGFSVARGDWWDGLTAELAGPVDVVVAYLPHVPDDRLHEVPADNRRSEEPPSIRGGVDGLDPLRTVLAGLGEWLAPGGTFLTLLADEQRRTATELAEAAGWAVTDTDTDTDDDAGVVLAVQRSRRD